jgi:hypothetical protein
MPSFWNTLRRWYSTVRGLRNSCAAISLFVPPSLTRPAWDDLIENIGQKTIVLTAAG